MRVVRRPGEPGFVQRGMTMVIALLVVAVLLFVAVVLLSSAFGSASAEASIRAKIAAFDAAEAGIDRAVEELDSTHGASEACGDRMRGIPGPKLADGGTYTWCIAYNGPLHNAPKTLEARGESSPIDVPSGMVYAWSTGTADGDGHGVTVGALIAPSGGLQLPSGALAAGGDVQARGHIELYASAPGAGDAAVHANGNIYVSQAPSIVEGQTFAVGADEMVGVDGKSHGHSAASLLPADGQIAAAAENARVAAAAGAPIMAPPGGNTLVTGNALFLGDLNIDGGSVEFERGQAVYIDGNICVSGSGQILNDGSNIWVSGAVSTVGSSGGYTSAPGTVGSLIALGSDSSRPCANALGRFAVSLAAAGTQNVGLIYAPFGSIDVSGNGTLVGALVTGNDLWLDGSSGNALRYDPTATHPVPTYDYRIVSYMEY